MHVLIIGIDRYDAPQLTPLQGSRNDAIAWYRFCVGHLGVQPENIAVLASPKLTPRDLGPEAEKSRLLGASRAEVLDEAGKLAKAAASGAGLLTYSGHGLAVSQSVTTTTGADLAICPTDVLIDPDKGVIGALRFTELENLFSPGCRDNVTVFLDTCYSSAPAVAGRAALDKSGPKTPADVFEMARRCGNVTAFTNRLLLGAKHWTPAYEIQVAGQWRGAASFALQTLLGRWALRQEGEVTYPDVSHADLLDRMGDMLDVLGVPQTPALWAPRQIDEVPVLRPGTQVTPGETSIEPDGPKNLRQIPIDPDYVGLLQFVDSNNNPVIRVVVTGDALPTGWTGLTRRTEYWYTNTTSPPNLAGLTMTMTQTNDQHVANDFIAGWTLSLSCGQYEGVENWVAWSSGTNAAGTLLRTPDPTGKNNYMGLYLEYSTNGTLRTYAWYRISLLSGGFAYYVSNPPTSFTAMTSTNPNSIEHASWSYSTLLPPGT